MTDVIALFEYITCTKPWTLDDSRALYAMLKSAAGCNAAVDINCPCGDQVFVTIDLPNGRVRKTYAVT